MYASDMLGVGVPALKEGGSLKGSPWKEERYLAPCHLGVTLEEEGAADAEEPDNQRRITSLCWFRL